DYSWNTAAFVNATSWEASFPAIVGPERAPAFRTIAPYLRYYDDRSPIGDLVARYKTSLTNGAPKSADILQELRNVQAACATMCELATSESESDRLLYEDLRPWLLKVQSQADVAVKFIETADMQDSAPAKWETYAAGMDAHTDLWNSDRFNFNYLNGMGSGISLTTLIAEPAQRTLMPFLDWLKTNALGTTFFPTEATRPEFVTNTDATSRVTYSAATGSGYLRMGEAVTLRKGDFVGVEFPRAVKLAGLTVADSAISVCTAYWSGNGKEWTALESSAAPDAHVKYIVFANDTDQPHSFKLTREAFGFTYPLPTKVSSGTLPAADELYEGHGPAYIYDGDYSTYACIKRNQQQGDASTITLQEETPLRDVRICMGTTNNDYMSVGRVQASLDGKTWRNLTVAGSNATAYTLALKQNVKYSDEMTYCDFDGDGEPAKYVRLYVQTANTEKWLRLYEIEPNVRYYGTAFRGAALDTDELTIDALTDAKGYTAFAPSGTQRNAFTYHFNRSSLLRAVTFYRSAANGAAATVSVTDDGQSWEELGTLTEAQHTFDLTAHPRALAVKVEWTRGTPAIYEVVEDTEDGIIGPATGISLLRPDAARSNLRVDGGMLHVSGASAAVRVNVYTADGRRIATAPLTDGTAALRIGVADPTPLIVETVGATGRRTASKLLVR
ncbi:MAG: discoidin domain-containing protein, partial [Alloprevotella sp.]|nr:discoidin domain-containing protein [Alloprevotella sp.]